MVFQEHLLSRQHDGQSSGPESPEGGSAHDVHDEPYLQVVDQTTFTHRPTIINTGAPTTRNRGIMSNAFITRSMYLPYIITTPQGA